MVERNLVSYVGCWHILVSIRDIAFQLLVSIVTVFWADDDLSHRLIWYGKVSHRITPDESKLYHQRKKQLETM